MTKQPDQTEFADVLDSAKAIEELTRERDELRDDVSELHNAVSELRFDLAHIRSQYAAIHAELVILRHRDTYSQQSAMMQQQLAQLQFQNQAAQQAQQFNPQSLVGYENYIHQQAHDRSHLHPGAWDHCTCIPDRHSVLGRMIDQVLGR